MYFSSFTKQNSNNQKKVQRSGGFKIKLNPISRQLIRMTWGSRFQLEMVKGSLVFVIGTFDDQHLQERVSLGCGFLNKMLTTI